MKKFSVYTLLFAALTGSLALAAPALKKLNNDGLFAMKALLEADPRDLRQFAEAGNSITSVTFTKENGALDTVEFSFVTRHCMALPPRCMGGATLQIIRKARNTQPTSYEWTSRVLMHRD